MYDLLNLINNIEWQQWQHGCNGFIVTRNDNTYMVDDFHMECEDGYLLFYSTDETILWMFINEAIVVNSTFNNRLIKCKIKIKNEIILIEAI